MPQIATTHDVDSGFIKATPSPPSIRLSCFQSVWTKTGGDRLFQQSFFHYKNTRSGAYIFAPYGAPEVSVETGRNGFSHL